LNKILHRRINANDPKIPSFGTENVSKTKIQQIKTNIVCNPLLMMANRSHANHCVEGSSGLEGGGHFYSRVSPSQKNQIHYLPINDAFFIFAGMSSTFCSKISFVFALSVRILLV